MPPHEALQIAIEHHRAGRLAEAEKIYRQILAIQPQNNDALHLLGLIAKQTGNQEAAFDLISRAIRIQPQNFEAWNNLAVVLSERGDFERAIHACRTAISLKPDFAAAHYNLADALRDSGQIPQAVEAYRKSAELNPANAQTFNNLANILIKLGKLSEAIEAYSTALRLAGNDPTILSNFGDALREQGKLVEAEQLCRRAILLKDNCAEYHGNLSNVLRDQGKIDEAIAALRTALLLDPDNSEARVSLGNLLKDQGLPQQALEQYDRAIVSRPDHALLASARVFVLQFHPDFNARSILEAQRAWDQRHGQPLLERIHFHNDRSPDRRLRIGYVSPDFRAHVVGFNMLPVIREHDRSRFEVFCYADLKRPDEISSKFQSLADSWRNLTGISDESVAKTIRDDRIDMLVDLALHSGTRLGVFARKAAPVQVTFAGYPGGTGLSTIDYRLTDPYLDPPGVTDADYVERSMRLPDSFWCYDPIAAGFSQTDVGPLPASVNRYITFGCLNNFSKVNDHAVALWGKVLSAVAGSRLLLLSNEGSQRQRVIDVLGRERISPQRVDFVLPGPRVKYLGYYNRIDIGLDTIPYNGHTTSLDSYWMGVPVVTMVGRTVVGRAGFSQLSNLGTTRLIAHNTQEYVAIAKCLAEDSGLADLRAGLRERMERSPLMDIPRFVRGIEGAYKEMWRRFVAKEMRE